MQTIESNYTNAQKLGQRCLFHRLESYNIIQQNTLRIKWFDGRQAFVLPATTDSTDILYIFTATTPLPDFIAKKYFKGIEPVYQPLDPRGVPIITVYRISPEQSTKQRNIVPDKPLTGTVGDDIAFIGYDLPETMSQTDVAHPIILEGTKAI
jgi:hypothetical protein